MDPNTKSLQLTIVEVRSILTRCSGYLSTITSHSLNPYRGCALGNALCGVGCYVRSSIHVTRGRPWGGFVEVRQNASQVYRSQYERERKWARRGVGQFSIFLSSVTEPFQPAERKHRITRSLLEAMIDLPPDELIVQTHSHQVTQEIDRLVTLGNRCRLRVHVSIESDYDRLPGLPPPASSVQKRIDACRRLKSAGLRTVVTVAPLLPIRSPHDFFAQLAFVADAVVIDHFVGGDGTANGARTARTRLPEAMKRVDPKSIRLEYLERMVAVARQYFPQRVGVGIDGFAGRFLRESVSHERSVRIP